MLNVTIGSYVTCLDFGWHTRQKKMTFGKCFNKIPRAYRTTPYHTMGRNLGPAQYHGTKTKVTAITDRDWPGHGLNLLAMLDLMSCTVAEVNLACQHIVANSDTLGTFNLTITCKENLASCSERCPSMDVKTTINPDADRSIHVPRSKDGELRLSSLSLVGLMATTQRDRSPPCLVGKNNTRLLSYLDTQRALHHDGQTASLIPG